MSSGSSSLRSSTNPVRMWRRSCERATARPLHLCDNDQALCDLRLASDERMTTGIPVADAQLRRLVVPMRSLLEQPCFDELLSCKTLSCCTVVTVVLLISASAAVSEGYFWHACTHAWNRIRGVLE